MLVISINGQKTEIVPQNLADLVAERQENEACFATAVNGCFVAQEDRRTYQVQEGDDIEILSPMQGG